LQMLAALRLDWGGSRPSIQRGLHHHRLVGIIPGEEGIWLVGKSQNACFEPGLSAANEIEARESERVVKAVPRS